jgi:hypothetical protein
MMPNCQPTLLYPVIENNSFIYLLPDVSRIIRQFNTQCVFLSKNILFVNYSVKKYIIYYFIWKFIVFNIFSIFYHYNIYFIYIIWNKLSRIVPVLHPNVEFLTSPNVSRITNLSLCALVIMHFWHILHITEDPMP